MIQVSTDDDERRVVIALTNHRTSNGLLCAELARAMERPEQMVMDIESGTDDSLVPDDVSRYLWGIQYMRMLRAEPVEEEEEEDGEE